MDSTTSLYTGKLIRLTRIEYEKDPEVISSWTKDAELFRMLDERPAHPLSVGQVKKRLENIEKEVAEEKNLFYHHIRALDDERLVGWGKIERIVWTSGIGVLQLAIGPSEQNKGYGSDALALLLRFTFGELNLHRLTIILPEYNLQAVKLLKKFGFCEEVRRREVIARDGRRWDSLHFGLLASDGWKTIAEQGAKNG